MLLFFLLAGIEEMLLTKTHMDNWSDKERCCTSVPVLKQARVGLDGDEA